MFCLKNKLIAHSAQLFTGALQNRSKHEKKIYVKGVESGSFLQCSAYGFVGHDDCLWKINLGIPKSYAMMTFK